MGPAGICVCGRKEDPKDLGAWTNLHMLVHVAIHIEIGTEQEPQCRSLDVPSRLSQHRFERFDQSTAALNPIVTVMQRRTYNGNFVHPFAIVTMNLVYKRSTCVRRLPS